MKKLILLGLVFIMVFSSAHATPDNEGQLRQILDETIEKGVLQDFFYLDFDGDEKAEAFALVKTADVGITYTRYETTPPDENNYSKIIATNETSDLGSFDLWFVNEDGAQVIDTNVVYEGAEIIGPSEPYIFQVTCKGRGTFVYSYHVAKDRVSLRPLHQVQITGDSVKLRAQPSLNGEVLYYVSKGDILSYEGERSTDDRGVEWYKILYSYKEDSRGFHYVTDAWVSSRYAQLIPIE